MAAIKKIVGISGSLRKASVNTGLLRAAQKVLPEGWEMEILDINFPLYNEDVDTDALRPKEIEAFKAKVKAADAVVFGCPEYNYGVTGVLKNAIDWGSRGNNCWDDKPATMLGAGGYSGSLRSQLALRQIALYVNLHMLNKPDVMVRRFEGKYFDENGDLVDEFVTKLVKTQMEQLTIWADRINRK